MNTMKRMLILALAIGSTLAALASTANSNLCAAQELTRAQRRAQKAQAKIEWDGESFRDVQYKQVGKQKLLMDIYLPDGNAAEKTSGDLLRAWGWLGVREQAELWQGSLSADV